MATRGWLAAAIFGVVLAAQGGAWAQEADLGDLPLAIICDKGGGTGIGYLSEIQPDGTIIYISADGRIAASVTPDGAITPAGDLVEGSCSGRTLDELRAAGRTIEMPG